MRAHTYVPMYVCERMRGQRYYDRESARVQFAKYAHMHMYIYLYTNLCMYECVCNESAAIVCYCNFIAQSLHQAARQTSKKKYNNAERPMPKYPVIHIHICMCISLKSLSSEYMSRCFLG